MEQIVVHFMFGDNLEWRSTFAVLCLLIELVTVATALYIFWSAGCFVGKTVKLYHVRKSMINIKIAIKRIDLNGTQKRKRISSTNIQDLSKKGDLMFLKNNYSQV